MAAIAGATFVVTFAMSPAHAKGVAALRIIGPGLDAPIQLAAVADGPSLSWQQLLHVTGATRVYSQYDSSHIGRVPAPPAPDLGPKYTATFQMYKPGETFVQRLYPFARPRPVAFAPAQTLVDGTTSEPSWIEVSEDLPTLLIGLGVPRSEPALERSEVEGDRDADRTIGVGAAGFAVLICAGSSVLLRRSRRHQPIPA